MHLQFMASTLSSSRSPVVHLLACAPRMVLWGKIVPSSGSPKDRDGLQAVVVVGQLGLAITVPIVGSVALGVYVDRGTVVLFGCIILGIAAGVMSAYRIIKPYLE